MCPHQAVSCRSAALCCKQSECGSSPVESKGSCACHGTPTGSQQARLIASEARTCQVEVHSCVLCCPSISINICAGRLEPDGLSGSGHTGHKYSVQWLFQSTRQTNNHLQQHPRFNNTHRAPSTALSRTLGTKALKWPSLLRSPCRLRSSPRRCRPRRHLRLRRLLSRYVVL